ncbi:MAG: TrkA C-terminal domain-containing protein [Candidatus Aenigmatarchaeota archaeon]
MAENVKELIEDMKNLSELMLDLAYSSVFFENKEIAKEVLLLYNNLEYTEERLYLHLMAASRGRPAKRLISVLDLVESSKFVATAARNMSELVLGGGELHPIIKEALSETDESITRAVVSKKSPLCNKTLGEIKLATEIGVRIVGIRRKDRWIFDPNGNTTVLEDDILIGVGPSSPCGRLQKLAKGTLKCL